LDFRLIFQQILNIINKLSGKQKIVIAGTLIAVVMFVVFLVVYNGKSGSTADGYKVLFDGVDPKDAALIIQQLQTDNIPYKIPKEDVILIPEDKVYEERMKLAGAGLPKSSQVGFELFDKQDFGATDFDQQVKYLRAIEGELSKTIQSLRPVQKATVSVAIPKETVFVSKDIPPTASVVLSLNPNMQLSSKQIFGIKNLVASSVPKLKPENVRIVNQDGEPLGEDDELTTSRELAASQLKYKQNLEKVYEDKILNILTPIIGGQNRVVAKVNIEFDFSQKNSTQEKFDPENVVRSEQNLEEKREGFRPKEIGGVPGAVSNIGPVQGLEDNELKEKYEKTQATTNYEISKTTSSIKGEFATVKRVSAAVVVDGKYEIANNNGIEEVIYTPQSDTELASIQDLVKQAIGYAQNRGDEVTVSNFRFDSKLTAMEPRGKYEIVMDEIRRFAGPIAPLFKYLVAALVLFIFYKKVIVPFIDKMVSEHEDDDSKLSSLIDISGEDEDDNDKLGDLRKKVEMQLSGGGINEDEVRYDVMLEKMKAIVEEKPEEVAALFQTLIRDELGLEGMMDIGGKGKK